MKVAAYRLALFLSSLLGGWVIAAVAAVISSLYFIFSPRRVLSSVRFYRALRPSRGPLHALGLAWRQFHAFAALFAERLRLARQGGIRYTSSGWNHLTRALERGEGGIIVMSHVGSWEIAARLFSRRGLRLLLFMGADASQRVERLQKADALAEGLRIVSSSDDSSVLNALEGLRFLRDGGFVSLPGDRAWTPGARTVSVRFLGREIQLPRAPYALALVSGAPLFVFFAVRTARGRYRISCSPARAVKARDRADRQRAIEDAAQSYADQLEQIIRLYPSQWYHFEPLFDPRGGSR